MRAIGEPFRVAADAMNRRQAIAAALLARRNGHLPPVLETHAGTLVREMHDTARRGHGLDLAHPELDGFLDRKVHPIARRDSLHKSCRKWRFTLDGDTLDDACDNDAALETSEPRHELPAATVEEHDFVVLAQSQHTPGVMSSMCGQVDFATDGHRHRTVQTRPHLDAGRRST